MKRSCIHPLICLIIGFVSIQFSYAQDSEKIIFGLDLNQLECQELAKKAINCSSLNLISTQDEHIIMGTNQRLRGSIKCNSAGNKSQVIISLKAIHGHLEEAEKVKSFLKDYMNNAGSIKERQLTKL